MRTKAFTLLELIIVIIIVGVLTSLALPLFGRMIERSRGLEAVSNIGMLKRSYERCVMMGGTAGPMDQDCDLNVGVGQPDTLDVDDPGAAPGSHFTYVVLSDCAGVPTVCVATIIATRNLVNGGDGSSLIRYQIVGLSPGWNATGVFEGMSFP